MKKILIVALALFAIGVSACKNKNSDTPNTSTGNISDAEKAKLLDKIWYGKGGVNFQWHSDGEYTLNEGLNGSWSWRAKGDTMNITNYDGQKWLLLWVSIGDNQAQYRTNQSGLAFKDVFTLSTTK